MGYWQSDSIEYIFYGHNAIQIAIQMRDSRMTWCKYRGYWWPGAYLAPGHLEPSCWRKPMPEFRVLNGMSHIHHQGISAVVADGLELIRHQYICKHHADVGRYPARVLNSVIIADESAWLLLMAWYLLGRLLGCPYFIHFYLFSSQPFDSSSSEVSTNLGWKVAIGLM